MVSPPQNKEARRGAVWQIAHGMVVLNLPDELAWTICVDWKDFEYIGTSNNFKALMFQKCMGLSSSTI